MSITTKDYRVTGGKTRFYLSVAPTLGTLGIFTDELSINISLDMKTIAQIQEMLFQAIQDYNASQALEEPADANS